MLENRGRESSLVKKIPSEIPWSSVEWVIFRRLLWIWENRLIYLDYFMWLKKIKLSSLHWISTGFLLTVEGEKKTMVFVQTSLYFHRYAFYFLQNLAMPQSILNWPLAAMGLFLLICKGTRKKINSEHHWQMGRNHRSNKKCVINIKGCSNIKHKLK